MSAWFFVDETDLALGRALDERYGGVLYPGHVQLPEVPRGANDDAWLDVVGTRSLIVITRDGRIRYRTVEKRMWVDRRVRGFVLTGTHSQSTRMSLEVLGTHWEKIMRLATSSRPGPWMYAVTARDLREILLRRV